MYQIYFGSNHFSYHEISSYFSTYFEGRTVHFTHSLNDGTLPNQVLTILYPLRYFTQPGINDTLPTQVLYPTRY